MAFWNIVCDMIFDFLNFDDDKFERPTYHKITDESVKFYQTYGTCLRDMSGCGLSDDIWHLQRGSLDYQLFTLFHECWHVMQKNSGSLGSYLDEHKQKYIGTPHMMMLYKYYEFEAEATGYAAAFVYEFYRFTEAKQKGSCKLGQHISDCYDCIEKYTEDQFDTHADYVEVNEKIKAYYDSGKQYFTTLFNSVFFESTSGFDELVNILGETKGLLTKSTKVYQLININNYL